ncbi:hypothetical protein ACFL23_03885 [Patescibacteria group bacterium]
MSWQLITILSYLINAVASVGDKILVSKKIPNPIAYSFYVGILSIFVVFLMPFGFSIPPLKILIIALLSGSSFLFALIFLFRTLVEGEPSRVFTGLGGMVPVFTLLLSFLILNQVLTIKEFIIFIILTLSGLLILESKNKLFSYKKEFKKIVISAFLFSLALVLAKYVYLNHPFMSGFIWTRLGSFITALLLLISSENRRKIFKTTKNTQKKHKILLVLNKILAGSAFLLLNFAISKGNVSLINAMKGTEYAFIFIIAVIFSFKFPSLLKENLTKKAVFKKVISIILIGLGLFVLSI